MDARIVWEAQQGAALVVHIQPKASRTECVGLHGDALKIRVAAPPVDGAANDELIRFVARLLTIRSSAIRIESGMSGRRKRMMIHGVSAERVRAVLTEQGSKGVVAG
jgi:uncharacterized protein